MDFGATGRLPAVFTTPGISSFTEFLRLAAPDLLPGRRPLPPGSVEHLAPHGTTIVAVACDSGVVVAGDRRATMGNLIASRDIEKVFPAGPYSVVGYAGAAGVGLELIRLFQVELEHYEKIEGITLSLHGTANRLASMIRGNLAAAMQGLAVLPLLAGFDTAADVPAKAGRIFSFDVTGGCFEESDFHAIGSGSLFAKSAMKKRYRPGMALDDAVRLVVEALYDAAEDDTATGGPDMTRKIYPVVMTATADGVVKLGEEQSAQVARVVVNDRMENPGG
ncbi:MAG TPA: proteasome subunit beta [Micromonosporaceae bacterium]